MTQGTKVPQRNAFQRSRVVFRVFAESLLCVKKILKAEDEKSPQSKQKIRTLSKSWAERMLVLCGVNVTVEPDSAPISDKPCLFVSNHVSYLDIPVLHALLPAAFIAKKEIRRWIGFGRGAAAIGTVFVDRSSTSSKKRVAQEVGRAITEGQRSIILFPEGTSSPYGKRWKRGAFQMAQQFDFEIQPVRIAYHPHRVTAYWNKDTFAIHLWQLMGLKRIEASVKFFPARKVTDVDLDTQTMQAEVFDSLIAQLNNWGEEIDQSALALQTKRH